MKGIHHVQTNYKTFIIHTQSGTDARHAGFNAEILSVSLSGTKYFPMVFCSPFQSVYPKRNTI